MLTFKPRSRAPIVNFEHVIAGWVMLNTILSDNNFTETVKYVFCQ